MDEVLLNNSPDLSMEEITRMLFNNEFMSDIQFHVGGKIMYAHSWEVMKRSIVFWKQFRTNLGENKLVPIDDVSYEAFYQFMKFIYTDEFEDDGELLCDMLKLAVRYKIVKLENQLVNSHLKIETDIEIKLLEFNVLNSYKLCTHFHLNCIRSLLDQNHTKTVPFLNLHETVMEKVLKSDIGFKVLTEADLLDALVLWMNNTCEKNQIPLEQRRSHFDKLIRLIRFPAMASNDFHLCIQKHHDLLSNDDIGSIVKANIGSTDKNSIWNNQPRSSYHCQWLVRNCQYQNKIHLTKFRVEEDLILKGVFYGSVNDLNHQIKISGTNLNTNVTDYIEFNNSPPLIPAAKCFGDSIRLCPNYEYSIEINFDHSTKEDSIYSSCIRPPNINAIVIGPSESVEIMEASEYLLEIIFEPPPE